MYRQPLVSRLGTAGQGRARLGRAWHGISARLGVARLGRAWLGISAWRGVAGLGKAWYLGGAWRGWAWHGEDWQGTGVAFIRGGCSFKSDIYLNTLMEAITVDSSYPVVYFPTVFDEIVKRHLDETLDDFLVDQRLSWGLNGEVSVEYCKQYSNSEYIVFYFYEKCKNWCATISPSFKGFILAVDGEKELSSMSEAAQEVYHLIKERLQEEF